MEQASPEQIAVREAGGTTGGAGRTADRQPFSFMDDERGTVLVEHHERDDGVVEHWRYGDGEHTMRFVPEGQQPPIEKHVPKDHERDAMQWFETKVLGEDASA